MCVLVRNRQTGLNGAGGLLCVHITEGQVVFTSALGMFGVFADSSDSGALLY